MIREARQVQTKAQLAFRSHAMQNSAVQESLRKLECQYGEFDTPVSEVRAMLDRAMGDRTLSEELHKLREG